MDGYWRRVAERGAPDDSPHRAGFAQTICVADTDEEAERLYSKHVSYFYNRCLHVFPGFADAPGYRTIKTIQSGALSQYAPPKGWGTISWKELTEGGHVIAGSPETVRQRMEELIKTPARRQRVLPLPCRRHAEGEVHVFEQAVRREGDAEAARPVPRIRRRRPLLVPPDRAGDAWFAPARSRGGGVK